MIFTKCADNPVLARTPGTFRSVHAANPDVLEFGGRLFFYFRGQGDGRHDQLGAAVSYDPSAFNGRNWDSILPEPILRVDPDPAGYDSNHILDPAAAVIGGRVFVYYSAHSLTAPHSVCLAVSDDGIHFEKNPSNPIIPGAVVPEVVVRGGRVCLFYQRWTPGSKGVSRFYMCESADGVHFDVSEEREVMSPGADLHSVSTNRIFDDGEWYYSFFGACRVFKDYPESIKLARSRDLTDWTAADCDIITRGEPGSWDEGALWFATVHRIGGRLYLWYEGAGTGNGRHTPEDRAASDLAINEDYGGYGKTSFSQIGMAVWDGRPGDLFTGR